MKPADWQNTLEEGETIIWEGHPDTQLMPRPVPRRKFIRLQIVAVLLLVFFYLVNGGFRANSYTLLFALVAIGVFYIEFHRTVISPLLKQKSLESANYAVTEHRILMYTPSRKNNVYSINYFQILELSVDQYKNNSGGDIILFTDQPNSENPSSRWIGGMYRDTLYGIKDVKDVEKLIRDRMAKSGGKIDI